jgi:tetraacyldisaccharide 4'-kinase
MKKLASKVYSFAADLKNHLYDAGVLDTIKVSAPVISVGNITMGGTGKTPVVDLLLTHLCFKKKRTALISRNYKAKLKGFHEVQRSVSMGALLYGDEPWLLAQKHPETQVFVGPKKSVALFKAHNKAKAEVYIVDDGFQHRALSRNLDLVLIDGSQPFQSLTPIPEGRGREGIKSLGRADAVLLTKTEQLTAEEILEWRQKIGLHFKGPIVELKSLQELPDLENKKVFVFSGIANPENFECAIRKRALQFEARRFSDHHYYSGEDLQKLLDDSKSFDLVLTTEKDFVKLQGTELATRAQPVGLKMQITKGEDELYALVDSIFR